MFSQRIRSVMERKKVLTASPQTSVSDAAQMMARKKVSAVMVVHDKRLVGIFTERDAVFRVIARGLDPTATPLAEVMTAAPKTVGPDESFGYALLVMHENGFRHVPVIENDEPIGIVSSHSGQMGRNAPTTEEEER